MSNQSKAFLLHFLLPVVATVAIVAGLVGALLIWSTSEVDGVAVERQRQVAQTVIAQSVGRIAHEQEASTVWDDAVQVVRSKDPDEEWLDNNLGIWFHTYYSHDLIYIVDPQNRPIYAMREGKRVERADLAGMREQAQPLIDELRQKMPADVATRGRFKMQTPGASDIMVVNGRPSIISAKPIVSETGRFPQKPGSEYVHISVRYLDGTFLADIARLYLFDGARFSWSSQHAPDESIDPLRARDGHVVGYVIWRSFSPGSRVMADLAPMLGLALFAVALIVALLLFRVSRTLRALKASEAQAQHLAFHDTLTGLANRALFEDRLDHTLAIVRRGGAATALFYLDLDRFKTVNDTLGHPAGDMLIRDVAARLKAVTRETDTVARLGGDEFAIIQADGATPASAEVLCLRLVEAINEPFDLEGVRVSVGVSIGVALAPVHGVDRIELSRKADIALYEAKANGRGRYVLFAEAMDATVKHRQAIERGLREALRSGGQLELHYQPIHDARTCVPFGAEALVRWRHPEQGMLSPVTFIPIAEECGLIETLGEWVLREACIAARQSEIPIISVNVSAVQLRNQAFADTVRNIIDATGLEPHRLEIEITETSFVENELVCQRNIMALRSQGVRIALDDFGTGYSSLNHLRNFDVDRLKVDRSFVAAIDMRQNGSAIIQAIVGLANARGIAVTAEGVETREQAQWLADIGCGALQGYLLSRPMPLSLLRGMFAAHPPSLASVAAH